jgi:hypothetical protein
MIDIARINLLTTTNKTIQDRSGKARSERSYLKKFDFPTASLTSRRNSLRRTKDPRTLIEKIIIFIDMKAKKTTTKNDTKLPRNYFILKNTSHRLDSRLSQHRQGWLEKGEPTDEEDGVAAARVFRDYQHNILSKQKTHTP